MPPPGVALGGRGASAVPARAYADDYGGGTMNQTSDYGGGTMNQASTPSPPTVEWDPRNTNTVTVIGNTATWTRARDDVRHGRVRRSRVARGAWKEADECGRSHGYQRGRRRHHVAGRGGLERRGAPAVRSRQGSLQIQVPVALKENVWTDKATGQRRSRIKVSAYSFAFVAPYNGANGANGVNGARASAPIPTPRRRCRRPAPAARARRRGLAALAPATTMGGYGGDAVGEKDDLWREVLDNPDAWWDNRAPEERSGR